MRARPASLRGSPNMMLIAEVGSLPAPAAQGRAAACGCSRCPRPSRLRTSGTSRSGTPHPDSLPRRIGAALAEPQSARLHAACSHDAGGTTTARICRTSLRICAATTIRGLLSIRPTMAKTRAPMSAQTRATSTMSTLGAVRGRADQAPDAII